MFAATGVIANALQNWADRVIDLWDVVILSAVAITICFSLWGIKNPPDSIVSLPEDGIIAGALVFFLIMWGSRGIKFFLPE